MGVPAPGSNLKIMRRIIVIAVVVFSCLFTSCSKEDVLLSNNEVENNDEVVLNNDSVYGINVLNGVLCFNTWLDYEVFKEDYYRKYSLNWYEFEIEHDFFSQRSHTRELLAELDEIETESQFDEFMGMYSHIFQYEDSLLLPKVRNQFLTSIANSEGYYCVENQLYRIYDGYKITYQKEKNIEDVFKTNVVVGKELLNGEMLKSVQIACGAFKSAECGGDYNIDNAPDRKKRRLFLECYAEVSCPDGCSSQSCYTLRVLVYGMKKKWIGGWRMYETTMNVKDLSCEMLAPNVTNQVNNVSIYEMVDKSIDSKSFSTGTTSMESLEKQYQFGETVLGVELEAPYMKMIKCKASSRGVGEYCATIDCGTAY